eukprot:SAG22_NODE_241_length_14126_cov_9.747202_9_plen_361_part_00
MKVEQTVAGRQRLAAFFDASWGGEHWPGRQLAADALIFVPLGEDSYCYELRLPPGPAGPGAACAADGAAAFFGRLEPARGHYGLEAVADRLEAAGQLCAALAAVPGPLGAAVVAPLPVAAASPLPGSESPAAATCGQAARRFVAVLPPDFAITLFRMVEGAGQVMPPDDDGSWVPAVADRARTAGLIGLLHGLGTCGGGMHPAGGAGVESLRPLTTAAARLGREGFGHVHRAGIEAALLRAKSTGVQLELDGRDVLTAVQQECCAALRDGERGVRWLLDELDALQAKLVSGGGGGGEGSFVLTHQEPHLANFCATEVSFQSSNARAGHTASDSDVFHFVTLSARRSRAGTDSCACSTGAM